MRRVESLTRLLYGTAAVLLLVGLAFRVVPAPAGPSEPMTARNTARYPGTPRAGVELPGAGAAIVAGNIFSAARAAPRERYTPPDLELPSEEARPRRGPAPTRLRLFGTVVGPTGTAALIDADPAIRGAEIYQVGDAVDGRRIVAVSESTVVLEGAAGRLVLRLQPVGPPTR